ncbi:hypothetical protein [Sorangium sp. So ce1389]|uniref:hypothetical protein n=1 Tax=Sorangium sp. So ce1389 TaxID=3133336 RepID=UPI003F632DFC
MVATLNHPEPARQANQKSPDELQRDLNPNHMAGQNIEGGPSTLGPSVELASEIDDPTRQLQGSTSDEPRESPGLPEWARPLQDAVYVDLAGSERRALRATAQKVARSGQYLVRQPGCTPHGLESTGTSQRPPATSVMRPSDAG